MCKELILILPLAMIYSPQLAIDFLLDNQKDSVENHRVQNHRVQNHRVEKMSKLQAFIILLLSPILVVLGIIVYIIFRIYLMNCSNCHH